MLTVSSLCVSDDHFDAARRAQESLYLVSSDVTSPPCRLSLPFTTADVLLQPRPIKICVVRPENVTALRAILRAIPRLDDLHVDVASIALHEVMSCTSDPSHGRDEGASVEEDGVEEEEEEEEEEEKEEKEEEEEEEALAKRLLRLESPAACPRFLEQRLLPRPVALPMSADARLRQTLGEARKLCPWPAAVTATREVHFRPSWSALFDPMAPPNRSLAGDVELLVRAVRLDTHPQLAAPAARDANVAEEARAFRERMRPRFEVSMALVPPLGARAHSKQLADDPVLLQLLRPTAFPATPSLEQLKSPVHQPTPMPSIATVITTATQASALPASTPDARRTIAARVLAPLSSARQRSERALQLLSAAFAPLPNPAEQQRLQQQQPPSPPQSGSLASDEHRAHPRKRNLAMAICGDYCGAHSERRVRHSALGGALRERPKPLGAHACTATRSHDPVQSMLVPRPSMRTAEGEALPASSIPRRLLVAHEANVLTHLLTKGDLCAQVRLLRHPDGLAASPHARAQLLVAAPAIPPLANDTIIGALLRPRSGSASGIGGARGGERNGLAQALSGNPSVAAVLGLPPGRLVAFRQSLEPRAENIAPPHAMATDSLAIRLLGDEPMCLTDECEFLDERMAEAVATPGDDAPPQRPPATTRQPPAPLTSAPMQNLMPPTSAAPSAHHRSAAPLPSPATIERAAQPAHARALLATEDVRAPFGSHVLSLHESFAESVDAFLHITHGIVPTAQRYGPASEGGAKEHQRAATSASVLEEPLSSKLLRHAHGSTGLLALLPECLCEHVPLIAAEVIATLAAADGLGVLWLLPELMIDSAYAFWCEYSKFAARATASLSIRRLPYVPVAGSEEPPLRAGELGLVPLHSVLDLPAGGPSGGEPPAALVLLTVTNPALDECEALGERVVGTPPRCRLVALVCGLPTGGALSLSPLCSALGVRRLLLRCERDPDVLALRATRRSVPFTIPGVLLVAFDRLVEDAKLELCEVLERRPELRPLPFNSRALKQCIEQTNAQRKPGAMSDAEQASFWGLMGVFCARRLIDCAEDADAESFRAFLAQVESKKQVKLTHTFARREALKAVLSQREPLASALEAFEASKHDALRIALRHALRAPAIALTPSSGGGGGGGGGSGGGGGLGGPPRHGAVAMGQPSRRPERVVGVCEQFLAQAAARHGASGGALGAFTVQLITAEMSAAQVISLVQRASAMDERLLLVVAAPELEAMLTAQSTTLWHNFAFVIEYDPLPDAQQLGALSHAHLCVVSLRPSDSPVVVDDDDDAADALEGRNAAPQGVGATPTAASAAQTQSAGGSALMQMARLLRDAHGRAYDDVLDVSSIIERASNGSGGVIGGGGDSGAGAISSESRPADALAASSCIRRDAVMIGDDLLRYPRLQALLQRKGIPLIETSVDLPHLILDHEAGVLVLDLDTLRERGRVAAMVAQCEPAYRSLWLVVLWDEGPRQGEALASMPKTERAASTVDLVAANTSAAIRSHVRELLVELSASPLKLSVRIARWSSCWPTMQRILQLRAADPLAGPLATSVAMADADQREETQHEMLLTMCGLNPWAARRVSDHYSLRDLLSLSPRLRISHFPWVTERALRTLAFVADSGNAERLDDVDEMVSAKPTPATVAPAFAWSAASVPIDGVMDGVVDGSGGGEGAWGDYHNGFVDDGFSELPHGDLDQEDDFCPTLGGGADGVYWPARQCPLGVSQQADASGQRTLRWGTGARRSEAGPIFISEPHDEDVGWRPGADGVTDGAYAAAAAFATVWAASPPPSGAAGAAPRRAPKNGTGGRGGRGGRGRRGRR